MLLDLGAAADLRCFVARLKHAEAITPLSSGFDSRCAVDIRKGGKRQVPAASVKYSLVVRGVAFGGETRAHRLLEKVRATCCYYRGVQSALVPAAVASSQE